MTTGDTLRLALRNLGQAKLRTALTTLGVAIGIASLAGMVSFGVGLQDQFVDRFAQSGVFDTITVTSGRLTFGRGGIGGGRASRRGGPQAPETPAAPLDDDAIQKIAAIEHVAEAYPNLRVPVQISIDQTTEFGAATGVPMSARDRGAFQTMAHGSFFANETDDACLLSMDMAKRLTEGDPKLLVGRDLTLTYATSAPEAAGPFQVQQVQAVYRIAGIVERDPTPALGGGALVSGIMIPIPKAKAIDARIVTNAQSILRGPSTDRKTYQALTVRASGAAYTQDVEDRIKALGFSAFSVNDALQGAKRGFLILDIILSLIGSIALIVSSLGIVNTMVMSILERTREIGVMKAIGGSDADVRRIFLVEASTIGILGGVTGVAIGWAVGRVINFAANWYIQSQGGTPGNLFSLPIWLIAMAIGFSWLVSLIAGSYPAGRAAKLDPIQALRHD